MSTLCQLWDSSVRRSPDHVALHHRGIDWTWRQLDDRARSLAHALRRLGFQPGDRLGLGVPNSVEYVVGYFGALLAGGVAVGLHPEAVPRELQNLLEHCDARAILATPAVWDRLGDLSWARNRILLTTGSSSAANPERHSFESVCVSEATTSPLPDVSPEDIAQIIYTSGTTGRPKGVVLSHSSLCANTQSIVAALELTGRDSVFVLLPFFYSYGNSLLLTHVAVGGRLVLASDFAFWNRALDLLTAQKVTGLSAVPSAYAMLLARSDFERRSFPDLRYLTCAGGALAPALLARVRGVVPHARFFAMYGQTEAAARLSILPPEELDRRPGSIGRGIPGVELRVLNEHGQPAAIGETGEIVARGANLMRGYWRDPELTASVLRTDGLHTGDLARVDGDGYLYIVGRRTDMIKSGAYRIAPLELEEVVLQLPGVAEVAVVGLKDELLGEVPVAYVVRKPGVPEHTEQDILDHCLRNLPRYKLVKRIVFVDELPKTPAGKIRRDVLGNIANSDSSSGASPA